MTAALLLSAAALLSAAPSATAFHPQHVTLAEAEWNAEAKTLEVSLRVTPVQLEQAVERHAGRAVDLDEPTADAAVAAWVKDIFVVLPPPDPAAEAAAKQGSAGGETGREKQEPEPAKTTVIGREVGISFAWVYIEVALPRGWEGARVTDRVRLWADPAQHNTLVLTVARPGPDGTPRTERATYQFDRKAPTRTLRAADLEPLKKVAPRRDAAPAAPR